MAATEDRAVDLLEELGFTEYEAKCLVALLERSEGTAADIAGTADIPRSRVYDVADSLADRNLVEVQEGDPRRYRALPAETVIDHVRETYRDCIDDLSETLRAVESAASAETSGGVWQLSGREAIGTRLQEFVTTAEDELVVLVTDHLLDEPYVETLERVIESGVETTFVTRSADLQSWLASRFPDARVAEAPALWNDLPAESDVAHLALVDSASVLMVAVTQETPAASQTYNATLIDGVECGFVLLVQRLLGDALESNQSDDA